MNRTEASKLAETVSLEDLKQMFKNAQTGVKDWTIASRVNKGLSLGVTYNILSKGLNEKKNEGEIHHIAKRNMIWAFGEFLPGYTKPVKDKKTAIVPSHQEPNFDL
jgi:hypothetical protein